jgi:hypothetical protein
MKQEHNATWHNELGGWQSNQMCHGQLSDLTCVMGSVWEGAMSQKKRKQTEYSKHYGRQLNLSTPHTSVWEKHKNKRGKDDLRRERGSVSKRGRRTEAWKPKSYDFI